MARISPRGLIDTRTRKELPKLGLCKIRTERLRDMTVDQLKKADFYAGPVNMKERMSRSNPRGLFHAFVNNLIGARTQEDLSPRSTEAYKRTYGEEPKPTAVIKEMYEREADRVERMIWNAQAKAGCAIAPHEVVARDAIEERQPQELVDKLRGKRRPKIR